MLEISTVGGKLKYCLETTAGTRPTSGYVTIPDVVSVSELSLSVDTLEATNMTDKIKRYVAGQQDPGQTADLTANHTDNFINVWEALVIASKVALAEGKRCWFEEWYPQANKSYYFCAEPQTVGTGAMDMNSIHQLTPQLVINEVAGWFTKSAEMTLSDYTKTVAEEGTTTVTVSNAVGTVTVESTDTTKATATVSTNTITITGVGAGACIINVSDNETTKQIAVTVTE